VLLMLLIEEVLKEVEVVGKKVEEAMVMVSRY
jgi:hypothetical protein